MLNSKCNITSLPYCFSFSQIQDAGNLHRLWYKSLNNHLSTLKSSNAISLMTKMIHFCPVIYTRIWNSIHPVIPQGFLSMHHYVRALPVLNSACTQRYSHLEARAQQLVLQPVAAITQVRSSKLRMLHPTETATWQNIMRSPRIAVNPEKSEFEHLECFG